MQQFDLFVPSGSFAAMPPISSAIRDRINFLRRRCWVPYPVGERTLRVLDDMLESPPTHRPPCLLIHGDTNVGKSMIAKKFAKDRAGATADGTGRQVVYVQNPPAADLGALIAAILRELGVPTPGGGQIGRRLEQLLFVMRSAGVRMLIIDEIHHVLPSAGAQRSQYLNSLKYLSSELELPMVLIGTVEALRAIQTDQQLGNRFEPYAIPRWKNDQAYALFLAGLSAAMGVQGNWRSKTLVTRFHALSEGLTGETWKLMCRVAEAALLSGMAGIDEDVLDGIDWIRPMDRRRIS